MIMRKMILATAMSSLVLSAAFAADVTPPVYTKAQKSNLLTFPYNGDGFYWGIATKMGVEQDSASGQIGGIALATGNMNATGGGIGGTLGYMHGMGDKWVAFEGSLYYQNVTAGGQAVTPLAGGVNALVPASFASRWSSDQVVKIGGWNPFSWLGNLGGFTFPTLPTPPSVPGITIVGTGHTYIMAGIEEWGISGQFFNQNSGVDVGVAALLGAGVMNQIVDSTGKLTGAVLDVGADVVFADKGLSVAGLFVPGTPVVSQLNSGRKYEAYAKVDF
jgi:hypothetical protein